MIICSDFDSTIYYPSNEAQTSANLAALKNWREHGHLSVLATNRSLLSLERALPDWRSYFDYLILDGGTRVYDGEAKLLWSNTFDHDTLQKLTTAAQNFEVTPKISFYNLAESDFSPAPTQDITKICFRFHTSEEAATFLLKLVDINAYTFAYHHDSVKWRPDDPFKDYHANVEAIPFGTNKAHAIKELIKIAHLSPTDITTVGDNLNDEEMLHDFTGYAIAGSKIAALRPTLPTTPSVTALVSSLEETAYLTSIPGLVDSIKQAQEDDDFIEEKDIEW